MKRISFGRRTRLFSYLAVWGLVGVILLAIPTLVSPLAQNSFTQSLTPEANTRNMGTTTTTTHRYAITNSNQSIGIYVQSNTTVSAQSSSPTNITFVTFGGAVDAVTITSSAPANVTVTTRSTNAVSASAPSISSNLPDFAIRLALILVPALVLSSLGLVRVRRQARRDLPSDSD